MTAGFGVYVHVPFCRRKCRYCDFYSRPPGEGELDRYVDALIREGELRAESVRLTGQTVTSPAGHSTSAHVRTVYIGGGTPSMLTAGRLADLLGGIQESLHGGPGEGVEECSCDRSDGHFPPAKGGEITVEVNPLDVTPGLAAGCRDAGFNRVSVGVQSVMEEDLGFLGRQHHAPDGPRAVEVLRAAGFGEIGIDLIYGLPKQTPAMAEERVRLAVECCRPTHVSAYQLTYAEGTPLWDDLQSGRIRQHTEEEAHALFRRVHETLAELGYPAYEVSNFSWQDEHRSRHNSGYWRHVTYVGLGPSAHSFDGRTRSWNVASVDGYLERVEAGESATAGSETLADEQLAAETIMLSLRTTDGLDLDAFRERFGRDLLAERREAIEAAVGRGLVTLFGDRLRPTLDGLAVADRLAAELS
ncbi:MAG: coproporphyrinogen-III oxidase family protein [Planctomycetota bacterium]